MSPVESPLTPLPPHGELARTAQWRAVVDQYLQQLDSANTRAAYERHLAGFFVHVGAVDVAELRPIHLSSYRAAVLAGGRGTASQGQALAAVRSFLRWCHLQARAAGGGLPVPLDLVLELLRAPRVTVKKPYRTLSEPEIAAAVAGAESARDRAILAVFLGAALRVSELVALDVEDLVEDGAGRPALWVRYGKGGKDRIVPVYPWVDAAVRAYLEATEAARPAADGALFLVEDRAAAARGGEPRLSRNGIWRLVGKLVKRAGLPAGTISPHSLRHSYAMRHLRAGGDLEALRKILGHAQLATTQKYVDHLRLGELLAPAPPPRGF